MDYDDDDDEDLTISDCLEQKYAIFGGRLDSVPAPLSYR